jgi:uncharacterized protein (DUF58 family)
MAGWKERGYLLTSIFLCAAAVLLGTLLYPLILLFFSLLAVAYPAYRRLAPSRSSSRSEPPEGSGA